MIVIVVWRMAEGSDVVRYRRLRWILRECSWCWRTKEPTTVQYRCVQRRLLVSRGTRCSWDAVNNLKSMNILDECCETRSVRAIKQLLNLKETNNLWYLLKTRHTTRVHVEDKYRKLGDLLKTARKTRLKTAQRSRLSAKTIENQVMSESSSSSYRVPLSTVAISDSGFFLLKMSYGGPIDKRTL